MSEKIKVLGVGFDNLTMEEAVEKAYTLQTAQRGGYVVTPNPEIVMICRKDPEAAEAVAGAALTIPDGIGVIYAAKLRHTPLKEKVPGCDFTLALLEKMAAAGRSVYLLGAKPGVAEKAGENLAARFPGLRVVGTHDGYFQDDAPVVAEIAAAAPDLLLVCLGAPKQEKWMAQYGAATGAKLLLGLGGSLDVFAGVAQRAPEFYCKHNLEWFYRLIKNPSRAGRMMKLPLFLVHVAGEKRK